MLGLGGCGGAESRAQTVADALSSVAQAVQDKDYAEACEGVTPRTRADLSRAAKILRTEGDCGDTLRATIAQVGTDAEGLRTVTASDVTLDSDTTATVSGVRMTRHGEEWLVEGELDFVRPFLSPAPPR